MTAAAPITRGTIGVLRRMIRPPTAPVEKCDLCSAPLASRHEHLVEPGSRRLMCACQACAVLFSSQQGARFRRVPQWAARLIDFQLSDAQWDSLLIPINLAFFFRNSSNGRTIAVYPSPAGATESLLDLEAWREIAAANPRLDEMRPDVEALLVNRTTAQFDYYLVSIDRCYELVGLIRSHWKGLSGGPKVWEAIHLFFENLKSTTTEASSHA
ncbi:MAG TPA: DUF5947 family protein [Pirellulales bacterium]|jgi:hypothetical protein|nr:DUF5947 family protein [Pirellulales bacterium]